MVVGQLNLIVVLFLKHFPDVHGESSMIQLHEVHDLRHCSRLESVHCNRSLHLNYSNYSAESTFCQKRNCLKDFSVED